MSDSKRDRSGGVQPYPALGRPVIRGGYGQYYQSRARGRGGAVVILLILAVVIVLAGYAALSSYLVLTLTRPARVPFERSPEQLGLAFDSVAFPSRVDGVKLDGWLLSATGSTRRPVVMVHGKGSDRQREADGRTLEIASALVRGGHPVLMFDLRGSGRSGGERFTLGQEEVRDVGGAIDYLDSRGLAARGVDLLGFSMGAASTILAASGESRVAAVVEDSGYAELRDVLDDQVPKASGLPGIFTPGVMLAARVLLGVDVLAIRPIEAVQTLAARGVPLLVIHGDADRTVDVNHGRMLVTAYGPKADSYFVAGAGHVGSYAANPSEYLSRLTAFLDRIE